MKNSAEQIEGIVREIEEILRFMGVLSNIEESTNVATRAQVAFEAEREKLLSLFAILQKHRTTISTIKKRYGLPILPNEDALFDATCGLTWSAIPEEWITTFEIIFPVKIANFVRARALKKRTDLPTAPWDDSQRFLSEVVQPVQFTLSGAEQAFKAVSTAIGPDFLRLNKDALGKKKKEHEQAELVKKLVPRCSICPEGKFPDHALDECKHCFCLGCAQQMLRRNSPCPLCRELFTGFHKIHQ